MSVPTISHPTNRPNFTIVGDGDRELAFSYKTVIGVNNYDGKGWIVRENVWGPTTGKHLNYLDDGNKSARLSVEDFQKAVAR